MIKFILKSFSIIFVIGLIIFVIGFSYYYQDLPNIDSLGKEGDEQIIEINYSNDERIANFGDIYHDEARFYQLPQHLINAVVATEDRKFFSHNGVDLLAIIRASYINHRADRIVQGGSTITQQLAKLLFLKPERTFKRKVQELILAFQLEKRLSKEQILVTYLNRAYFGSGSYGISSAAKFYFDKKVSDLNLQESSMLAGLLKAPSKFSPKNDKKLSENRTNIVLRNMIDAGYIDEKYIAEIDNDIAYKTNRSQRLYFADFVHDQFKEFLNKNDLDKKLITVTSTLDCRLQQHVEDVANKFVDENKKKLNKSQIAVVILNRQGAVLAMIGGIDYQKSQYNRAIYAKRQMGSLFKTFVYLTAYENDYELDDEFEDKKINIGAWLPDNYNNKYLGKVDLKTAFAQSLNSVSIQLVQKLDRKKIINTAKKLGISSDINANDLTIALGTTESSLFELTSAYAGIANKGHPVMPYFIEKISDKNSDMLYQHQSSGFEAVISDDALKYIQESMRAVITDGTGRKANIANDIYGKTGTSQDFRDAWFIGFNDQYIIGVWIGNDDNSPTNKITGGSLPAELFAQIIKNY